MRATTSSRRVSGATTVFTGVRPGEKLVEELLSEDEPALATVHESISRISPILPSPEALRTAVGHLRALAEGQRDDDVRAALFASTGPVIDLEIGAGAGDAPHVASDDAPTTQTD